MLHQSFSWIGNTNWAIINPIELFDPKSRAIHVIWGEGVKAWRGEPIIQKQYYNQGSSWDHIDHWRMLILDQLRWGSQLPLHGLTMSWFLKIILRFLFLQSLIVNWFTNCRLIHRLFIDSLIENWITNCK